LCFIIHFPIKEQKNKNCAKTAKVISLHTTTQTGPNPTFMHDQRWQHF
jgi:hypothetical protein